MKPSISKFSIAAAAIIAVSSAAFIPEAMARPDGDYVVRVAPPQPRYEHVPAARHGYVWAPGYWSWNGRRHIWIGGHWERVRRGHSYRHSEWRESPRGWYLERGGWNR
ncbi:hypothetical protein BH11PSE11_BH11PSE11_17980 [soil metagenome]